MLFWNGRSPLDSGDVSLQRGLGSALTPAKREAMTPMMGGRKAVAIDAVTLVFHIDVVEDARWLALLTRLFAAVASQLDCFFAAGFCDHDRKGRPVNLLGRHWMGIPNADLWLVWVGPPYRVYLPSPTAVTRELDGGALIELGPSPVAWDQLHVNRIEWAPELMRDRAEPRGLRQRLAMLAGHRRGDDRAAKFIPSLADDTAST
jgi:hypothetical protein